MLICRRNRITQNDDVSRRAQGGHGRVPYTSEVHTRILIYRGVLAPGWRQKQWAEPLFADFRIVFKHTWSRPAVAEFPVFFLSDRERSAAACLFLRLRKMLGKIDPIYGTMQLEDFHLCIFGRHDERFRGFFSGYLETGSD